MIDAKTVEELRALWRGRNEATSCAACGGPYPNADCGHAKNAADFFQPAPCRPDTTSAFVSLSTFSRSSATRASEDSALVVSGRHGAG